VESLLRLDQMPSAWCPGCGIGIVVNTLMQTFGKINAPRENIRLVTSGISCVGRIPDYVRLSSVSAGAADLFQTALMLKRKEPELMVVAIASDNDLIAAGGEGLVELMESGESVLVLYLNSYALHLMVEHRRFSDLPVMGGIPAGSSGTPFNIPRLADAHGALFAARWTPLHCRRIALSLKKALRKPGPALIEVIIPCLMYFASRQGTGTILDRMGHYLERAELRNHEPTDRLDGREDRDLVIGTFIDR